MRRIPGVREIRGLARAGAVLALATVVAAGLAGCAGAPTVQTPSSSDAPPPPAPPSGAPGGVTKPADVFGPACAQLPQSGEPGSVARAPRLRVAAAISAVPTLKSFTSAMQTAGLTDWLNQQKEVTIFVPYDRGFANFKRELGGRYDALMANKGALADQLKYHVVVKRYDRVGLVSARNVTTLQGGNLRITDAGDTMEITDNAGTTAHVLCGNIPTANGTVFVIDNVLAPKKP